MYIIMYFISLLVFIQSTQFCSGIHDLEEVDALIGNFHYEKWNSAFLSLP